MRQLKNRRLESTAKNRHIECRWQPHFQHMTENSTPLGWHGVSLPDGHTNGIGETKGKTSPLRWNAMEKMQVGRDLSAHERCNELILHLSGMVSQLNDRQDDSRPVQGMDVSAGGMTVTRRVKDIAVVSEVEVVHGLKLCGCANVCWRMLRNDLSYSLHHFLCRQRLQALEMILTIALPPRPLPTCGLAWQSFRNGKHMVCRHRLALLACDAEDTKRRNAHRHA